MKNYEVPKRLTDTLSMYVKKAYLPEKWQNPKFITQFTNNDINFFAEGVARMSNFFTSERSSLPTNYLNDKKLRAGYVLYFVSSNYLKVIHTLEQAKALERFKDHPKIRIADIGSGPGTASLACADYFANSGKEIEITAIDQNTSALHDAKKIFTEYSGTKTVFKTVFAYLQSKVLRRSIRGKFDIIICANLLSEIREAQEKVDLVNSIGTYLLDDKGICILMEPALRWTTRNLMKLRDAVCDNFRFLAPCCYNNLCPMLSSSHRDWCHTYIDWKRPEIIEKMDKLIGNRKEYLKFSYLVMEKITAETIEPVGDIYRVVSAAMRSKGKTEILLCNKKGMIHAMRQDKDASATNRDLDRIFRGDVVQFDGNSTILKESIFKKIF